MSTVKIPPVLRSSTGGAREVEAEGETVGDVLRSLAGQHPATESQLFSEEGELNRYVNVYLNDLKDYKAMNEVFLGRFGAEPGVRTTIAAAGGIPGDSLVEIDCIAYI